MRGKLGFFKESYKFNNRPACVYIITTYFFVWLGNKSKFMGQGNYGKFKSNKKLLHVNKNMQRVETDIVCEFH